MGRLDADATVQMRAVCDPLIGERLGEYEVVEKLSEGGMGAVYRGVHRLIGKPVAIKVLLPRGGRDRSSGQRLLAEARAVNAARHANIVDIFGFGTAPDGRPYFVMELLTGQPLSGLLRCAGKLELGDVVSVLIQVMEALCAAHQAGVVHRDLKPSNLFAIANAGGLKIKVLDFGLARAVSAPLSALSTLPGSVLGTPGFMAPEQISWPAVGPAADIYAMGAVTFLLATGREVFCADSDVEKLRAHLDDVPVTLRSLGVPAPRALEALVAAMLLKDPRRRPTAQQVLGAALRLQADLQAAQTLQLDIPLSPRRREPRSAPLRHAAAGAAIACLLVAAVGAMSSPASAEPPPPVLTAAQEPELATLTAIEISLDDVKVGDQRPRATVAVKPSARARK